MLFRRYVLLPCVLALVAALLVPQSANAAPVVFEGEAMSWSPAGSANTYYDANATGTQAQDVSGNGLGTWTGTLPATVEILVKARAQLCSGAPNMTVAIDAGSAVNVSVTATTYTVYTVPVSITAGSHTIKIGYTNDYYGGPGCDRNLWIDTVSTGAEPPTFVGDYETGNANQWPVCQSVVINDVCTNYNNGHYSIQVQNTVKRQGSYAAKFEVRDGDVPFGAGERAEVQGGSVTGGSEGQEGWYQWSTQFSSTFPTNHATQGWGLVSQWHPNGPSGSPPVSMAVDVADGQWGIRIQKQSSPGVYITNYVPWKTPLAAGTWQDVKFHIKWSASDTVGFIEFWHNGVRQTFTDAPCSGQQTCYVRTMIPTDSGTYFKQGYYRNPDVTGTGIVYHDGFRSATTEAGLGTL